MYYIKTTIISFFCFAAAFALSNCSKNLSSVTNGGANNSVSSPSRQLLLNTLSTTHLSAAWYVTSPQDINALENIRFNLFFLNRSDYETLSSAQRDSFIQQNINAMAAGSQLVLPIDNFLAKNWFDTDGMEQFLYKWGNNPRIYGFMLKDDVTTSTYPGAVGTDSAALWKYRWYYHMIRNDSIITGISNTYHTDLAPSKQIIVTLGFDPAGQNSINSYHYAIRPEFVPNFPPDFLTPHHAWDIVMPYWYPHRTQITQINEDYLMDVLYPEMYEAFQGCIIPIIQTAAENNSGLYLLEHDNYDNSNEPHGYNLSIQYNKFLQYGLVSNIPNTAAIAYYSANGHSGVYDNLLHKDNVWDTSSANIYYHQALILNNYHFQQ
jgi:hypothetical protein